ncbi:MAG: hypothetical protein ACYSSO_09245 [Planctomycetota bacterium]|jgi:ethanolamine utilization cobalamin adenosyltransferase
MKRPAKMAFVLAVGIVVLFIAGCEEQNLLAVRKSRLVVLENEQLKVQLEECKQKNEQQKELFEKELEEQKRGLEREIKKQGRLLDRCLKEKMVLANTTEEYVQGRLDSVFKSIVDENVKLNQENKDLKAEIERLREEAEKSE